MKVKDFFTKKSFVLEENISLYVCGPTVYDHPHIGNMRPILIFDILNRVASLTSNVTFVHNITDIDNKIINEARNQNKTEKEIANYYEEEYIFLLDKLKIIRPTHMPKVTDNIEGIINFIKSLVEKEHAYEADGSVYFSIKSFKKYGLIDNIILDTLINSENHEKRDNRDFVLWKNTSIGVKFESPWGLGRPGWHTECAYLVKKYFGSKGIDIHGGGIDLKFPHHINEMAQYEAETGSELSKSWIYVGHLTTELEKMSKSEGNFITAKDFMEKHSPNVLRYILISTSFSKPINLTTAVIENAENCLSKFRNVISKVLIDISDKPINISEQKPGEKFVNLLTNNLDIPSAITYLMAMVKRLNSDKERKDELIGEFIANLLLLGFEFEINFDKIKSKITNAKETKNFEVLDKLREELIK